jgi:hypothetical protein
MNDSKVDILIRSMARPAQLDRCLLSIARFASGVGRVVVMDDGTPSHFLNRIHAKHPSIILRRSDHSERKADAFLRFGKTRTLPNLEPLPISLWRDAGMEAGDYLLLLEDDNWLAQPVDLSFLRTEMAERSVCLLRMMRLGHPELLRGTQDGSTFYRIVSRDAIDRRILGYLEHLELLRRFQNLKTYSSFEPVRPYRFYASSCSLYEKEFYLSLWQKSQTSSKESTQLELAIKWLRQNPTKLTATTVDDWIRTSFATTATPRSSGSLTTLVNHLISIAWYSNKLSEANFDSDIDVRDVLVASEGGSRLAKDWEIWSESFRSHYRSLGYRPT